MTRRQRVACAGWLAATGLIVFQLAAAATTTKPDFSYPFACGERYVAQSYDRFWSESGPRPHSFGATGHEAIDFRQSGNNAGGDPVLASAGGWVYHEDLVDEASIEDPEILGKGYVVIIDHDGDGPNAGWDTYYAHVDDGSRVPVGARVGRGQQIASMSSSGAGEDQHLHYEQRLDGVPQLVGFHGEQIPYWLYDYTDPAASRWAPDSRSQQEVGSVGPWLTPASDNCTVEAPPAATTTTTTPSSTSSSTTSIPPFRDTVDQATSLDQLIAASDFDASDGDVLRLYWAFFNREPDLSGAKYWLDIADRGTSLDVIAEQFAVSQEFFNTYGAATTNRSFVVIVYQNVLSRSFDESGARYWTGQLDTGALSRGGVVRWIAANQEFIDAHPYGSAR